MLSWLFGFKTNSSQYSEEQKSEFVRQAFEAIRKNESDVLNKLLNDEKVDPNARQKEGGFSLLHMAVKASSKADPRGRNEIRRDSCLNVLLLHKAEIDVVDRHSLTPLHLAYKCNLTNVIELLITNHAKENISDDKGKIPSAYKR